MRASKLILLFVGCLISLQAVDFSLTWVLLESGVRSDVYEANPLANAVLAKRGWLGLAGFKVLCTAVALTAGLIAWVRRPAIGLRLLAAECVVMAGVVGYSAVLVHRTPSSELDEMPSLELHGRQLGCSFVLMNQFNAARAAICQGVVTGEADLNTGIAQMRELITSFAPRLSAAQRLRLPDPNHPSQIASYLYHHGSRELDSVPSARVGLERLGREMAQRFPTAPRQEAGAMGSLDLPVWVCQAVE